MSLSRIHCHIIIGIEFKEEHILEEDELFCCVIISFPGCSYSKESACNAGDPGSIPGSGRSLEKEMATHSSVLA